MKDKKLFLDSANVDDVRRVIRSSAISGVTTNPSLVAKEYKTTYIDQIFRVVNAMCEKSTNCENVKKHISVEAISTDPEQIYNESCDLLDKLSAHKMYNNLTIFLKVPVTLDNLSIITRLRNKSINVNATAIITTLQAKMAADAGANIVSFFYRRGMDAHVDMSKNVSEFRASYDTEIICGSIRTVNDVINCWKAGAHIVTAKLSIIDEMVKHEKTTEAINQFEKEITEWRS